VLIAHIFSNLTKGMFAGSYAAATASHPKRNNQLKKITNEEKVFN
jgi:hypothetical protein